MNVKSFHILTTICLCLASSSAFSQKYQIALATGPALMYVVEDAATETDYSYGMSYQNDFIFLDEAGLANFGFSLNSSSTEKTSDFRYSNGFIYYGKVNNTSIVATKYFTKRLFTFLTAGFEVGGGLNHESFKYQSYSYYGTYYKTRNQFMLNLQIGGRLQAEILPNFFLHAQGLAVGQDVTDIIRFFSTNDWDIAGEDMHLLLLFGLATNFGSREGEK